MITWMTKFAYGSSSAELDDRRLGIQKDQVLEILDGLTLADEIPEHPVFRMWQGYEYALCIYGMFHCMEWTMKRGFTDKVFWELGRAIQELGGSYEAPQWIRDKDVIRSHRSNLMRRWPEHYSWPGTPENMPYLWPVILIGGGYAIQVSDEDREMIEAGERRVSRKVRERIVNL